MGSRLTLSQLHLYCVNPSLSKKDLPGVIWVQSKTATDGRGPLAKRVLTSLLFWLLDEQAEML